MAEFNFCLEHDEYSELINLLLEKNYFLIPLAYYKKPKYQTIKTKLEFDEFYDSDLSDKFFCESILSSSR